MWHYDIDFQFFLKSFYRIFFFGNGFSNSLINRSKSSKTCPPMLAGFNAYSNEFKDSALAFYKGHCDVQGRHDGTMVRSRPARWYDGTFKAGADQDHQNEETCTDGPSC